MKPILSKWSTGNFSKNMKINVYLFLFAHFLIGLGCLLNLSSILPFSLFNVVCGLIQCENPTCKCDIQLIKLTIRKDQTLDTVKDKDYENFETKYLN